jgi:hypothetical protein
VAGGGVDGRVEEEAEEASRLEGVCHMLVKITRRKLPILLPSSEPGHMTALKR